MKFFFVAAENGALSAEWNPSAAPPACQTCGRRTTSDPAAGYEVHIEDATELKDLNHAAPAYVASARFIAWYHQTSQSGLAFYPFSVTSDRRRARIIGAARLDASSRAVVREQCVRCGYRYYEVEGAWHIDQTAWDGSSFFAVAERPSAMFCTEAAMAAMEDSELTGLVFLDMDLVAL